MVNQGAQYYQDDLTIQGSKILYNPLQQHMGRHEQSVSLSLFLTFTASNLKEEAIAKLG